jgi:hypothetical protein
VQPWVSSHQVESRFLAHLCVMRLYYIEWWPIKVLRTKHCSASSTKWKVSTIPSYVSCVTHSCVCSWNTHTHTISLWSPENLRELTHSAQTDTSFFLIALQMKRVKQVLTRAGFCFYSSRCFRPSVYIKVERERYESHSLDSSIYVGTSWRSVVFLHSRRIFF